ncbi:hypothetical protein X994_6322 (plasmid) [Burkholderia pseudomallei]|nr:hypothetical protein X994_6322 [Burkholderia pseudomallei]KGD55189.1 hypothetical protein DP49_1198 [Burkholderia pseudomallei]KGW18145.1 hypothetical protein X980_6035 [Burkholderia pseudomallei MSHR4000]KGW80524.1 hypothetical protein Y048_6029 [Burkholderia pseudomallei MSHR456]
MIDVVGNLRLKHRQSTQYLDGAFNGARMALSFMGGMPKHGSQVWSVSIHGNFDQLPPDTTNVSGDPETSTYAARAPFDFDRTHRLAQSVARAKRALFSVF